MRRTFAPVLVVAMCLCAACGGSGSTISSATALRDLKRAGFAELEIARSTQTNDRYGEIDKIALPDVAMEFLPSVQLIDYASDKAAIHFYGGANYVARQYLADRDAGEGIVPRGFVYSPKKAFSARICNVILWSYNIDNDPRLPTRLHRATHLLRRSCG